MMKNILLTAIWYAMVYGIACQGFHFSDKSSEEYDEKLSQFILEILENFREQMPDGIPDIGVPPIDPLVIPNIDEDIQDGIAKIDLRMRNLTIAGLKQFEIKVLKADLEKGFANFSISVPELTAEGHCYMDGKILKIFPITGDGPFFIRVTEVSIDGYGELNVTTEEKTRLHMDDLKLSLSFGPLDLEFKSLLGGGRFTEVLIKILTGVGRKLFFHFHEEAMTELNKALLKLINKELDKGTLSELLDQIKFSFPMNKMLKYIHYSS